MNNHCCMWSYFHMDRFIFTLPDITTDKIDGDNWIQLTPKGEFSAVDGRGPFITDDAEIFRAAQGKKLPIDINHAIDIKGIHGEPSPAIGWIVELQARETGIWGRVEWTNAGKELLNAKAYGSISPVLYTTKDKPHRVVEIARASLCNAPALPQLKSLFNRNGEYAMDKELRAALGLSEDATDNAVIEAAKKAHSTAENHTKLMSNLCHEMGLDTDVDDQKLAEIFQSKISSDNSEKTDLAKQVQMLNAQLIDLKNTYSRKEAEAFVSKAISEFKIVPALKDHFIQRYMRDPEEVKTEINVTPALMSEGLKNHSDTKTEKLSAEEQHVCALMGVDEDTFLKTKTKEKL